MLISRILKHLFSPGQKSADESRPPPASPSAGGMEGYSFTVDWFSPCIPLWKEQMSGMPGIGKILEIGAYEGRSAVWLIENAFSGGRGDLYCVDTWKGGVEHQEADMRAIEERFLANIATARSRSRADVAVHVLKGDSLEQLAKLAADGQGHSFDLVHVDGSHQCADVLCDAVLAFHLCKVGGLIIFDDYCWSQEPGGGEDLLNQPKLAIDSFVNCYRRKLAVSGVNLRQVYLRKTAD